MGTAIGAPKRKRTKRTSEQVQSLPYVGGLEAIQDALRRIEEKNDTVPSKNSGDQNENVSIAGNGHCTMGEL